VRDRGCALLEHRRRRRPIAAARQQRTGNRYGHDDLADLRVAADDLAPGQGQKGSEVRKPEPIVSLGCLTSSRPPGPEQALAIQRRVWEHRESTGKQPVGTKAVA
jgi:hypothetical protein